MSLKNQRSTIFSIRVLYSEINAVKSSLRNIKIIIAFARTIENYLTIVSPDGNLLDDYIVVKLRQYYYYYYYSLRKNS